jgi:UDP-N-acetylmuramoyl-L-alanyl-D-glutamate--2,6-diaminopimelate ligase
VKIKELLIDIPVISQNGNLDQEVTGLSQNSKLLQKGNIFFAVKGSTGDGTTYIPEAIAREASAVIKVPGGFFATTLAEKPPGTSIIEVADVRSLIGPLAARFYGNPSEELYLTGVTGTNGKTTTTYIVEALLGSGIIGTIDFHYQKNLEFSTHTTPDGIKVQGLLRRWVDLGAKSVAMEVSSHGLVQKRLASLQFDSAIFTNLTRDHLDFHGTMEEYIKAKAILFKVCLENSIKKNKRAILNCEDSHYKKLLPSKVPVWTYGFSNGDFKVAKINLTFDGTDLEINTPMGLFQCRLNIVGRHNVANTLGALAVAVHSGVDLHVASKRLSQLSGVPGRLQRVTGKNSKIRVFVDYAHTDDGLEKVLGFLKKMRDEVSHSSKIITVFGCGGDRDTGKRPLMMKAAMEASDRVIVTSDNPRTEDPEKIISDIVKGTAKSSKFAVDADRRQAIQLAIDQAKAGDIVIIAGKGHENYQIIGDKKYPFDDASIAKEILDS